MFKNRLLALVVIVVLVLGVGAVSADGNSLNYRAHLTGADEATPNDSQAQGQVIVKFSEDLSSLEFKLIVANLENITAAHIHVGPPGVAGPVVVPLFGGGAPGVTNGVLSEGTATSADLVGPLAGMTLADLVNEIEAGNAYVNVHTTLLPAGEIRGQLH